MVKITEVTKITTHGTFETHGTIATHETIGRYGTQKYFMKQTWVGEDWTRLADFQFFSPKPPTSRAGFETKFSKVRHQRAVFTL